MLNFLLILLIKQKSLVQRITHSVQHSATEKLLNTLPRFPAGRKWSIYAFTSYVHKLLVYFGINPNDTSIFIDLCCQHRTTAIS